MLAIIVPVLWIAAVTAVPTDPSRIAGGSLTTINNYPSMAALLVANDFVNSRQDCGGSIINNRAILTAAHCLSGDILRRTRVRLGSTWSNSGGIVFTINRAIIHPNWGSFVLDSDIAIVHTSARISFSNVIQAGSFAGANYHIADNQAVWAAEWGSTGPGQMGSEQLKHVQKWTVNQAVCNNRFGFITDNMFCIAARQQGNSQCGGDSGSPVYHNNVIIGVCSFGGPECGNNADPNGNVRVSRFISWIQANA